MLLSLFLVLHECVSLTEALLLSAYLPDEAGKALSSPNADADIDRKKERAIQLPKDRQQ